MKLILNLQQFEYLDFLDSKVDILTIGLEGFSSGYFVTYKAADLQVAIDEIHKHNKQIYLAINLMLNEEKIAEFNNVFSSLKEVEIDGFVVNDWGVLDIFRENNLMNKVIFNPVTTITNKFSADLVNKMGVNHVVIANELNITDLKETVSYCKGNVETLAQGYYQICNSKRPLLSLFFSNFKLDAKDKYYKIKEETRDYAYPIIELNNEILVFIDKQRCTLPYFKDLKKAKVEYLRIDTIFLTKEETDLYVDIYSSAIKDEKTIDSNLEKIKDTNSNLECLDNISILRKGE